VQRTGAHCWLGEGEQEEGKSLTGERGWRQAPVLATGGSSVVRIEARRRPALVLRSTQKKEASSKLEHELLPGATCHSRRPGCCRPVAVGECGDTGYRW
jgi:hypothetical protein